MEKMRLSLKISKRTYGLKPGCTVQSVIENFIFTSRPIAHVSLFHSCFIRNKTNDRSFLSIRGYGALKELYGGALRPR